MLKVSNRLRVWQSGGRMNKTSEKGLCATQTVELLLPHISVLGAVLMR
jgi:hypothetical protein